MSGFGFGKLGLGAVVGSAVVALVAGCASSSSSGNPAGGAGSGSPQGKSTLSGSASTLKTMSTPLGTVLVDSSGHTVYELVGDSAAKMTCTSGCFAIWPPVEANGKQVIVNGHPAYTYIEDKSAGQTKGQNLTDQWGLWLALDAAGNPIHGGATPPATPASSSKAKAPGGGGPAF